MLDFAPPPATRDMLPQQSSELDRLGRFFARTAEGYGFARVATPIYERADLFAARSGPEIRNALLTFHCDHEEYALRPEMTAPVCRMVASGVLDGTPRPHKLFYIAPCYRYCRPHSGRWRELTQAGIEMFGDGSPAADAEVMALAHRFLRGIRVPRLSLSVGSAGVFRALLPDGLSDDERATVIGHLDRLAGVVERCATADASQDPLAGEYLRNDRRALASLQRRSGYEGPFDIADCPAPEDAELSRRLPEEAAATYRHLWKAEGYLSDETGDLLVRTSRLRGEPGEVWDRASALLSSTTASAALDNLMEVCRQLEHYGSGPFQVSLGIARGLTFYTGTVFEMASGSTKLCGGGRYDRLVELFGGRPLAATGCAVRLDALQGLCGWGDSPGAPPGLLLQAAAPSDERTAVALAEALRDRGVRVGAAGAPVASVAGDTVTLPDGTSIEADPETLAEACRAGWQSRGS